MLDSLSDKFLFLIEQANHFVWSYFLIYLLVAAGCYFSVKLKLIQLLDFKHIIKIMLDSRKGPSGEISSFQSFCTGLGARVGSGNVAGVAVAIHLGGPGAVFWMWVMAFLGMATGFMEGTLAQLYKEKSDEGNFIGGPAFYLAKGLGSPLIGSFFAFLLILTFGFAFNAVQANTLVSAVHGAFQIDKTTLALFLCLATAYVIMGGIVRVSQMSEVLVPFMALFYLLLAFVIILLNLEKIPGLLDSIFGAAFGLKSFGSGAAVYSVMIAAENGIKRGLFSNEAGMGSTANAAATASPLPRHPVSQGYIQMFSVFVDTIIVCTITAFIILLSGVTETSHSSHGIILAQDSLAHLMGVSGPIILAVLLIFFAFTSIAANYSYAETNLLYLSSNKLLVYIFRILLVLVVFLSSLSKVSLVWSLADSAMAIMATINLVALLLLSKQVLEVVKDYREKRKGGRSLEFKSEKFEAWK